MVDEQPILKTCPDCAEEVKQQARICRYCGHEFRVQPPDSAAPVVAPDVVADGVVDPSKVDASQRPPEQHDDSADDGPITGGLIFAWFLGFVAGDLVFGSTSTAIVVLFQVYRVVVGPVMLGLGLSGELGTTRERVVGVLGGVTLLLSFAGHAGWFG